MENYKIRTALLSDLDEITELEAKCFPEKERALRDNFERRLLVYPDRFFLLELDGKIVAMVNGLTTDETVLTDEMFADTSFHKRDGRTQMIFGVETEPEYQHRGFARCLLRFVIDTCRKEGRESVVLTCKEKLLGFYASVGFVSQGLSESEHGGAVWYQMKIDL